jgi:predicted RNase H-like HicB family nuclease
LIVGVAGLAGHACYDPGVASVALTVEFTLRVVLYPAPDIEGQWIAHGLETDVVTQGDSPEHALAMMADALQALASHQALRRRPTLQLRPAPTEIWDLAANAVPLDLTAHVDRRRRGTASPSAGPWGLYGLVSQKPPASRAR